MGVSTNQIPMAVVVDTLRVAEDRLSPDVADEFSSLHRYKTSLESYDECNDLRMFARPRVSPGGLPPLSGHKVVDIDDGLSLANGFVQFSGQGGVAPLSPVQDALEGDFKTWWQADVPEQRDGSELVVDEMVDHRAPEDGAYNQLLQWMDGEGLADAVRKDGSLKQSIKEVSYELEKLHRANNLGLDVVSMSSRSSCQIENDFTLPLSPDRPQLPYRSSDSNAINLGRRGFDGGVARRSAARSCSPASSSFGGSLPSSPKRRDCRMGGQTFRGTSSSELLLHPPDSPPVIGRTIGWRAAQELSFHHASGPSNITMPQLKRTHVPGDNARTLWPPEASFGPGAKAKAAEVSQCETPSIYVFLRSHFDDVDVDRNRQVSERELKAFILARSRKRGQVPDDLEQLLVESARRCYHQVALREDAIRIEDWVHFNLMSAAAPSPVAHDLITRKLRQETSRNPFVLKEILNAFEEADVRGGGILRREDVEAAFINSSEMLQEIGVEENRQVDYYQFTAYCLGYRRRRVCLHWYDISQGYAKWVPPTMLGGSELKGIWHTGVVVFGKEYWYGGKVLSSTPGVVPFASSNGGGPAKVTELGYTLRTCEELEDFLRFECAPRYTKEKYDWLRHNCNHFVNEVVDFLIQGATIPDNPMFQPNLLLKNPIVATVQSYMNDWLGGFDTEGHGDAEIDDLISEWRARLWPGDLALVVSPDHHEPIRLVQISNVDTHRGVCDVTYFEPGTYSGDNIHTKLARHREGSTGEQLELSGPDFSAMLSGDVAAEAKVMRLGSCVHCGSFWDWRVMRRQCAPLSAMRPHTIRGKGLAGTIGAGLAHTLIRSVLRISNPEIQKHLRRKAIVYAHCRQGHIMKPKIENSAWDFVPRDFKCGICCSSLGKAVARMECTRCSYYLCNLCDRKGLFKGYYSLGSIDAVTVQQLLQEPPWVDYKARRYLAASGCSKGRLEPDVWRMRVAPRVFGDLGLDLPPRSELMDLFSRFHNDTNMAWMGLEPEEFANLYAELLTFQLLVFSL